MAGFHLRFRYSIMNIMISQTAVKQQVRSAERKIQCIVGKHNIPFGKAQSPHLWDYADGIDTIEFLLKKKLAGIL